MATTHEIHCPVDDCDHRITVEPGEDLGHQRAGHRMRLHDEHPDHSAVTRIDLTAGLPDAATAAVDLDEPAPRHSPAS